MFIGTKTAINAKMRNSNKNNTHTYTHAHAHAHAHTRTRKLLQHGVQTAASKESFSSRSKTLQATAAVFSLKDLNGTTRGASVFRDCVEDFQRGSQLDLEDIHDVALIQQQESLAVNLLSRKRIERVDTKHKIGYRWTTVNAP